MPDKVFLTEDQIVDDIIGKMTEEERETWIGVTDGDIIMAHHTTGRQIRNEYKLWDMENPYTAVSVEPNEEGVIDHPMFPDQVSSRIMTKIRDKVNAS